MSLFGFSFGKKKSSGTSDINMDRTESTVQNSTGSTTGSSNTNSSSSGTSATNTSGTQTNTTSGTQSTTGNSLTNTSQMTQSLSNPMLGRLEGLVNSLMGGVTSGGSVSDFDKNAFVDQGMSAATAKAQAGLDENIGGILDAIGGRNNSMAALLSQRAQADTSATLAGANANLTAQAEEIARNNALAGQQVAGGRADILASILEQLRGGSQTTSGTQSTQTAENTSGTQTGTQTNASSSLTSEQQQQQQIQNTIQNILQSMFGSTNTTGHEVGRTTGSQSGFGLSLAI